LKTWSDEGSESSALYTLTQIGAQSAGRVGYTWGDTPQCPGFLSQKEKKCFFHELFISSFLQQLFYNDSLDQKFLSVATGWFVNPLEELASALGAFEVETAWVVL